VRRGGLTFQFHRRVLPARRSSNAATHVLQEIREFGIAYNGAAEKTTAANSRHPLGFTAVEL